MVAFVSTEITCKLMYPVNAAFKGLSKETLCDNKIITYDQREFKF